MPRNRSKKINDKKRDNRRNKKEKNKNKQGRSILAHSTLIDCTPITQEKSNPYDQNQDWTNLATIQEEDIVTLVAWAKRTPGQNSSPDKSTASEDSKIGPEKLNPTTLKEKKETSMSTIVFVPKVKYTLHEFLSTKSIDSEVRQMLVSEAYFDYETFYYRPYTGVQNGM